MLGKSIRLEGVEVLRVESEGIVRDVARYPVLHHLIDSRDLRIIRITKIKVNKLYIPHCWWG